MSVIRFITCPKCFQSTFHPVAGSRAADGNQSYECDECGHTEVRASNWEEGTGEVFDIPRGI